MGKGLAAKAGLVCLAASKGAEATEVAVLSVARVRELTWEQLFFRLVMGFACVGFATMLLLAFLYCVRYSGRSRKLPALADGSSEQQRQVVANWVGQKLLEHSVAELAVACGDTLGSSPGSPTYALMAEYLVLTSTVGHEKQLQKMKLHLSQPGRARQISIAELVGPRVCHKAKAP